MATVTRQGDIHHITNCKGVSHQVDLLNINNNTAEREQFYRKTFSVNTVKRNIVSLIKPAIEYFIS